MSRNGILLYVILLLLSGCAAPEILESRDGSVPAGVDFSGNWLIRNDQREDQRRLREAIRRTDGMKDEDLFRNSGSRNGETKGGMVYVFLETGSALRISQTPHGLFIPLENPAGLDIGGKVHVSFLMLFFRNGNGFKYHGDRL